MHAILASRRSSRCSKLDLEVGRELTGRHLGGCRSWTTARLRLHIPTPPARPGEAASSANLRIPEAGAVRCPDSTADSAEMRDLAYDLVRVLDEDGRAVGPWDPKLEPDILRRDLRAMLLTRIFDDRMFRAHRQGNQLLHEVAGRGSDRRGNR